MKKVVAVTAGFLLALAPAGTALAGETGSGNAWGNCRNSSAGGVHAPLLPELPHGKGNGGLQAVAKALEGEPCAKPATGTPDDDEDKSLEEWLGQLPDEDVEAPVKQY